MNCPKCKRLIEKENVNIQTDIAQCVNCGNIFKVSETLSNTINDGFNIDSPPKGAWIKKEDNDLIIGATTRSPIAFFLVPFMLVWTGGALGGLYGSQFINGEFNLGASLFGIPFIIGAIIFCALTAMTVCGEVEITA